MTTETAPAGAPALEVHVTLIGGDTHRFAVDDQAAAQHLLADLHPSRLFSASHLWLGGDGALTILPCAGIERLDLRAAGMPTWPYLGGAQDVREVSEEEFRAAYDPTRSAAERREAAGRPGAPQAGYTEYTTRSGRHAFWEVHMASRTLTPVDFRPYLQTLLGSGGLHARTADGLVILNPANLTRLTFHPGPPTLPAGVWPARRL